jgi:hypothetical protein
VSDTKILLSWQDNVYGATSYSVQRSTDGLTWTLIVSVYYTRGA